MARKLSALASAIAALSLLMAPAAALAAPSEHSTQEQSGSVVVDDICPSSVTVAYVQVATETDRYDGAGNLIGMEVTIREQDTFSAEHTLVSEPFTFHLSYRLDRNGELVVMTYSGLLERVVLPDGSMFVVAGAASFPEAEFVVLSPDRGHTPDIAAFCAALGA